jgi:hypothetical protein
MEEKVGTLLAGSPLLLGALPTQITPKSQIGKVGIDFRERKVGIEFRESHGGSEHDQCRIAETDDRDIQAWHRCGRAGWYENVLIYAN